VQIELKEFQPISEKCGDCHRAVEEQELGYRRCTAYVNPSYWWSDGRNCPLMARQTLSIQDVVKMAIQEGIIIKDGPLFVYGGRKLAGSIAGLIGSMKQNRQLLTDVKRKLGMQDIEEESGKIRVGQQKQKKGR
jgi:hypothetical protein